MLAEWIGSALRPDTAIFSGRHSVRTAFQKNEKLHKTKLVYMRSAIAMQFEVKRSEVERVIVTKTSAFSGTKHTIDEVITAE